MKAYLRKMKASAKPPRAKLDLFEMTLTCFGLFISISTIFFMDAHFSFLIKLEHPLRFASMGASAVLIFALSTSPYSQPRNVIGGHFFSAFMGVTAIQLFHSTPILAAGLAVLGAGMIMLLTDTMHPPGGATALLPLLGSQELIDFGYFFIITPCLTGTTLLVLFGLLINNLSPKRKYPIYW